ncbi:uncharacterized protein [Paramisgurnus dabryanus]|uniref:uncharacterized protein n=1 Tax=Paramisgurnus dabryanus TaxID=90735 RepID=UPI0031F36A32
MDYIFQEGNKIQPVSFLNELNKLMGLTPTTIFPLTTKVSHVTSFEQQIDSAVVTSTLTFNSSSPVPSEALVLSAIKNLRDSRESQLDKSLKLLNVTYNKTSDTSYELIFEFNLSNISTPNSHMPKGNLAEQVQNATNAALNTLLNDPQKTPFVATISKVTTKEQQIEVSMNHVFMETDDIQPVSYLNELNKLMGLTPTTISPLTTKVSHVTSFQQQIDSAVVTSTLTFSSSSPVPSEALVLSAIKNLRDSRESKLDKSLKLLNVTYNKTSDTSYELIFEFNLSNLSTPNSHVPKGNPAEQVQNAINAALNTLLNDPQKPPFVATLSKVTTKEQQIEVSINHVFTETDEIQPVSFLNELNKLMGLTPTTISPLTTKVSHVTSFEQQIDSAVVTSTLTFNSSSPVPSKGLVLSAIKNLRDSRESQLDKSLKLLNVTYNKISETCYEVIFEFSLSNLSTPNSHVPKGNPAEQVQNTINAALNTLLNDAAKPPFDATLSKVTTKEQQIEVFMNVVFTDTDHIQPVSFLNELRLQNSLTTPSASNSQTTTDATILGTAFISIRLVFETLGLTPSESKIMELVSILNANLTTKQDDRATQFGEPVSNVNVSYNRISDHSYALNFGYVISNVSMSTNYENRNTTYKLIQNKINELLNKILNDPSANPVQFDEAKFLNNLTAITAVLEYNLSQKNNIKSPSTFLQKILNENSLTTTPTPTVLGKAIIYIRLVFITRGTIPSQSAVLQVANNLLDKRLRSKRDLTVQKLSDPVSFVNVTYTKISDHSYALNFGFEISNVTMSEKLVLRNDTHKIIQDSINKLLNEILNDPNATPFVFKDANFTGNTTVIKADVEYVFSDKDFKFPSPFLSALITVNIEASNTTATTTFPSVVNTTGPKNSTTAAWVVAIIVPCAIAIMLVPCWILLCCLLCGCCARIRRRWHRRQSYNVQYTTRHSIF